MLRINRNILFFFKLVYIFIYYYIKWVKHGLCTITNVYGVTAFLPTPVLE